MTRPIPKDTAVSNCGLYAVQVAALGEHLAGLDRDGIAPAAAVEVLKALPILSPAAQAAAGAMVARTFAPLFPIALVAKDLGYAAEAVGEARSPLTTAARDAFATARDHGFGNDNITGVLQVFEEA